MTNRKFAIRVKFVVAEMIRLLKQLATAADMEIEVSLSDQKINAEIPRKFFKGHKELNPDSYPPKKP